MERSEPAADVIPPQAQSRLLRFLGPGLITGASDDDPSGIATYSQAGAQFGLALGWTMFLTWPLMVSIQLISARIGRTTGHGIAGNLRRHCPKWLLLCIVSLLLAANTVNIGANLGAMADATRLVFGGPALLYLFVFATICAAVPVWTSYRHYVAVLRWMTLALLAYIVTLFAVDVPWREAAYRILVPTVAWSRDYLMMIVAVFGTTISPYLFFWQASEEAEDVSETPHRAPLKQNPGQGPAALERIRFDTMGGMAASNIVGLAIILTAASTLRPNGITDVETSAQAAEALRPLAGSFASTLFALGIVGTGLLAVPVLAGSAAYALGEALHWPTGLTHKPKNAKAFYGAIVIATIVGAILNATPVNPMKALVWTAVINGIVAVPVMGIMMYLASRRDILGPFAVAGILKWLGWLTTTMMAAAVVAMMMAGFA
ncbi:MULTISPECIES: NRAMP family divalent metal transporter [unclassified Chelatococcus]|uniref:NRAMP family divalent metal transporter n=1 Tax=unclassified Chelatococcus TaxID=2638111 RepID=UPI0003008E0A|nr:MULTISPECIES: divalent metal cation transporter [unclassified Chelatococcus]ALA17690.1 iron transporter [Chelatococcus sp. CO-6]